MPRFVYNDIGGGLNQGQPPHTIQDREWIQIRNFYPFATKLRRRGGTRRLVPIPNGYSEQLTGVLAFRPETGLVQTLLGSLTTIAELDGNNIVALPALTGFAIATSTKPWTSFEYKNIAYWVRENSNGLVRSDGTYYGPSGISEPATAPTLAAGAAGDIPAASFIGVYTYYNSDTGVESNPSPASAVYAHAGSLKINWSGITVSSNAQVDSRRLYRTLPDQTGEYYFVAQIDNNSDTTFTGDNVLVQDLGEAVSFDNGIPPSGLHFGAVWKERLFVSDKVDVFYSESGQVENFAEDAIISVFPDDGHEIRAIHAYGDRLVIGKTNKVHYLVGSGPDNFSLLTLSDRHGCASHHSMQSAEGILFWLGLDNVYRSDGNSVVGLASVKLQNILANLLPEQLEFATGTVFPSRNWYVLMIPGTEVIAANFSWESTESSTEVSVDATASEGDGLTYAWDFGDGDTGTGVTTTHNYVGADPDATFQVTLTVTGADGSATATTTVTVNKAAGATGSVEGDPSASGGITVVYNYKTDAWAEFTHRANVQAIFDHFTDDFVQDLYVTDDQGFLYRFADETYRYDDSHTATGQSIICSLISKPQEAGNPGAYAIMSRVYLAAQAYSEFITLSWLHEDTILNTKVKSLDFPERWKTYALSTRQGAKADVRFKIDYTGATMIELEGWAVDGDSVGRLSTRPH